MQNNLVQHFLDKEQVKITDFSLINNVDCDNIIGIFNSIFNFDWSYEILDINETNQVHEMYLIIAVFVPGRVITSMASSKVFSNERNSVTELLNKALVKALNDMFYCKNYAAPVIPDDVNSICEEDSKTISATDIEKLEESIKNDLPKNEYGIRADQINFINQFKLKHSIDTDEKFNRYVQIWSDNNTYEINTKKELILAGEKIVDEFITWISLMSSNEIVDKSIVSPI